jgi:hypothetical protein
MPDIDWQSAATFACVLAAVMYMLLRLGRFVCGTRVGGCGGCGDCTKSSEANSFNDGEHLITEDQITVTIHDDNQN